MLFVMDVGNSQTVCGVYAGDELREHWRLATTHFRTDDELRVLLTMLFQQARLEPEAVSGCCISSVVPQVNRAVYDVCARMFGIEPLVIGPGVKTGLVIQVDNPREVGADRIVNAVAAIEEHGGPLIVVDFGTATTFDAVSADAVYKGGCIVPGIQTGADALFERCAKLPRVEVTPPPTVIGKDTVSHIRAGLTYGYADLVDGLVARIAKEMNASPTVVATGGLASVIAALAQSIDHVDPFLTLKGLKAVYRKNLRASS